MDTPSFLVGGLIGGLIGFLFALAITPRRAGDVNVAIQHNIGTEPADEDEADWWKRGEGPPEFSDN